MVALDIAPKLTRKVKIILYTMKSQQVYEGLPNFKGISLDRSSIRLPFGAFCTSSEIILLDINIRNKVKALRSLERNHSHCPAWPPAARSRITPGMVYLTR